MADIQVILIWVSQTFYKNILGKFEDIHIQKFGYQTKRLLCIIDELTLNNSIDLMKIKVKKLIMIFLINESLIKL